MTEQAGDRLRGYIERRMSEQRIGSVSELARLSHVSRDTFQQWWRGRPPTRSTAEMVARVLDVTYADIIEAREGHKESPAVVTEAGLSALSMKLLKELRDDRRLIREMLGVVQRALDRAVDNSARIAVLEGQLEGRVPLGSGESEGPPVPSRKGR